MTVRTKVDQLTTTEAAVLGLLSHGPRSGYDLRKAVESSVGLFWAPAKSQIYVVLPRLVEAGFATAKKVAQEQRPDKSVYRLTGAGRVALKAWLEETLPPDPAKNLLLTKVFFGNIVSADVLAGHIRQRRLEAEQLRAVLEEIEARADPDDLHRALTRGWGLEYTAALIRWAKRAERELSSRGRNRR
jgi:PadR family transcriptional regulator, regulatory protein AphA